MGNGPFFFISYSRKQYFIAKQLAEFLSAHGISVWLDVERIAPGDDWQASIEQGFRQCQALIVLASQASYRSLPVRYEVEAASKAGKPMYLVVIESCPFVTWLAGRVAVIDARSNFSAASTRLAQSLKSGQLPVERIGRSHPLNWIKLPLGQIKLIQLLLLNACFLLGTIAWISRIQISLINWPIDPRIEPYLVLALTIIVLWFLSFSYSIFLLFAFRYQRRVSFLELDLWPILCVFLIPMLLFLLTLHLETEKFVSVPGFGGFFNSYFSIQYRMDTIYLVIALYAGFVALFYLYLRYIPHGKLLGVAALICAVSILPSTSVIVSGILLLVVSVGIAIWQLRETLTGETIPSAFGARDQRLAGLYTQWSRMDTVWGKHTTVSDADRAWGYWLSPGAFFIDPVSGARSPMSASPVAATRGKTWRLHYLPTDRRCAQRVRQILASQPALSEVTTGEASYEIAILSNRTPQQWIATLASTHPRLIGIMVSAIDIAGLPSALHQNQWIDYRQQRPEAIRRLAAVIAGTAEPATPTTPEDFARPLGPFPLKLVSHALRINGFVALVLAASALLIQQLSHVALVPTPLIVFSFALGIWSIWSGIRILARNIVFAELCALFALSVLNAGLWASQGGSALLPRTLSVTAGPYNGSLTSGIGFIAAVIALPLMVFLLLGWIELLLHMRSFLAWLPASIHVIGRRSLAVSPWRQLDFAYVPYVLSCLILIGMVVGDSPARYAPIHEFDLPDQNTKIVSFVPSSDDNIWFATYTFSAATSTPSSRQIFGQYAIGYITSNGTSHLNRYILPSSPFCSFIVIADCPVYFGKDGSLTYLNVPLDLNTQPSLIWLTANGTSTHKQLPADALSASAVFDGAGNLWYMRALSRTQVAIGRMDSNGQITTYPYQPSTLDIVAGRDGTIWLNDRVTHSIIHISTDGVVRSYAISGLATDVLTQLALSTDGTVWFYELHSGTVGHLLADGTFTFIPTKLQGIPVQLLVGANNTVWLSASSLGTVEYLSPTGAEKSFTFNPSNNDVPRFAVGGDGNLYFSLSNQLGRITQHGNQHFYPIPTLDAKVQGLVAGRDGRLWFSETADSPENWSIIGELIP